MIDTTITPDEQLQALQDRRSTLRDQLADVRPILQDEKAELARARAEGRDDELYERRHRIIELTAEADELAEALQLLEQREADLQAVVAELEKQRKIDRAAELREVMNELCAPLRPLIEEFARKQYAPQMHAARVARMRYRDALIEALQAQGLEPWEIHFRLGDLGAVTTGWPHLDQALDGIAESLRKRDEVGENTPE